MLTLIKELQLNASRVLVNAAEQVTKSIPVPFPQNVKVCTRQIPEEDAISFSRSLDLTQSSVNAASCPCGSDRLHLTWAHFQGWIVLLPAWIRKETYNEFAVVKSRKTRKAYCVFCHFSYFLGENLPWHFVPENLSFFLLVCFISLRSNDNEFITFPGVSKK